MPVIGIFTFQHTTKISFPFLIFLMLFYLSPVVAQRGEIIPLSPKVGTVVDAEENTFYNIFPEIKGFESAQFYQVEPNRIVARIVFVEYAHKRMTRKVFTLWQFTALQNRVNRFPMITEDDRKALSENFTYLETVAVLKSIPLNQYVTVKHRNGKRITGTLLAFDGKWLEIQTPVSILSLPIWNLERISYRQKLVKHPRWKPVIFIICAATGLAVSEIWNEQTNPRIEMVWHFRFLGTVLGLLAASEVMDSVDILTTPKKVFALTPGEMDRLKK